MLSTNYKWICTAFIFVIAVFPTTLGNITLYPQKLFMEVTRIAKFTIETKNFTESNVTLTFAVEDSDVIRINPSEIVLQPGSMNYTIRMEGLEAGHSKIFTTSSNPEIEVNELYLIVNVHKRKTVMIDSENIGWLYFVYWIWSYCPQIIMNFKSKSVVGLSFDYLGFSMVEYVSFGIFIHTMYFSPAIQNEYFEENPRGFVEVKLNDVFQNFTLFFMVSLIITQCFIYKRGSQVLSIIGRVILVLFGCFYIVLFILRATGVIEWLDFIYYCLYLTIVIRILKYIPQAYMNYVRKSTVGWSIIMVLFNLIGGIYNLFLMLFNSYNYNKWISIRGNPRMFGLGLFTIFFQILFIIQHYVLYKTKKEIPILFR